MREYSEIKSNLAAAVKKAQGLEIGADGYSESIADVRKYTAELNDANEVINAERKIAAEKVNKAEKKYGKFSVVKFMREIVDSRLSGGDRMTGLEADVRNLGAEECKLLGLSFDGSVIPSYMLRAASGQNYTTDADGGYLKETMGINYIDALREKTVVNSLGATFLGDLVGTLPIVTGGNFSASWLAEGATTAVSKMAYSKATMTPHRMSVKSIFTRDLLRQTSIDVEMLLQNGLTAAHAEALEAAAIKGSGTAPEPTGILNTSGIGSVAMGTNGAAITWAKIVALETALNAENSTVQKLGYLTNAKVIGDLKTLERTSGNGKYLLADDKMLNGYAVDWTNIVPSNLAKGTASTCSALIFGDWSQLYIGQWGGIDLVLDPYTLADTAEIKLIMHSWNDVLVARPKAFAAIMDITTNA